MMNSKPILLVEDDSIDIMAVQRALNKLKVTNELVCKVDGREALEYLQDDINVKPCIILLDLNMPRMGGFELLEIIKAEENLKSIPVVIFTTTGLDGDITKGFELGADSYITKPADYVKFIEAIKTINLYWSLNGAPNTDSVETARDEALVLSS